MPQQTRAPSAAPVMVGVDGSDESVATVAFAAEEASRRKLPLLLVHCFMWPSIYPPLLDPEPDDPGPRQRAEALLRTAAEDLAGKHPELEIKTQLRNGPPAAMLVDGSSRAELLVVGHRGPGGFPGLHVGSVAIHAAAHAHCPVIVVRGSTSSPHDPVVVGVDGSPEGDQALAFAVEAAHRRGAGLRVVTVWPTVQLVPALGDEHVRASAVEALRRQLDPFTARHPHVPLESKVVHGDSAAKALLDEARDASLVVVGSRGRGGLRGILLGSTGRALIAHAPCPVAVVRGPA